ncbi:MAG: DUF488 family protein [Candidatus Brocadiaceae bacterium]|nr:DUF488 family protein [Candidatus Brocadiaceae bacterium]
MAIKTKSVYEEEGPDEGYRLLIMRIWPRGVKKDRFDEWDKDLSPSPGLLKDWLRKGIPFKEFKTGYVKEMGSQKEKLKALAMRAKEEIITLFCHEKEATYCHRRILKELIERQKGSTKY